jgi:hypothetical protein
MTAPPLSVNGSARAVPLWPDGTAIHPVAFTSDRMTEHRLIGELPPPLNRRAVALPPGVKQTPELELLSIPCDNPDEGDWCDRAREWVSASGPAAVQTITFQGAVLVWGVGRAAVLAPANRLPALEGVLAEVAHYEAELRETESRLGELWPELEADAGPAFDFDDKAARHHERLANRYAQLLGLRARLTRVLPYVLTPHVYPPTLASQVSERLRERLRQRHRVEMIQEQLEVFERVYDTLGQKANEYKLARKGHILEMVIIVMLAAQLVLSLFSILTTGG